MVNPWLVPEVRFPAVRETIPGGTDAILCYVHGNYNGNVSYKFEGVVQVIRRSRATLIFSMGVPIVKPQAGSVERVSSCKGDYPWRYRRHLLVCL